MIINKASRFFNIHSTQFAPIYAVDVKGTWSERKNRLREKFPILTENDLILDDRNRNEVVENLKAKLGKTEKELHDIIISL